VTVITGAIETNIFANAPEHHLPEGSLYAPAASEIAERAAGADVSGRLGRREDFARKLVGDIMAGATGKVYRGNMSSMIKFLTTYMPMSLIVSILRRSPFFSASRL
jgi:hypothetical protein